jgi:hypothetical protein
VLKLCERGAIEFAVLQAKITVLSAHSDSFNPGGGGANL